MEKKTKLTISGTAKKSIKKIYESELFKINNMSDEIYEEYINNVDSKFRDGTEFLTWTK